MFLDYLWLFILLVSSNLCENNNECSLRDSCYNQSESSISIYEQEVKFRNRNCFCDQLCQQYGDCCHSTDADRRSSLFQCVDFLSPTLDDRFPPFSPLSVWMKTQCLPIYIGSNADQMCRNLRNKTFIDDPILFIPVTSLQTNVTYRNYYCAYCNNDHQGSIELWEYKAFCQGSGTDQDYLKLMHDYQVQYYVHKLTRNCRKTILYPHERGKSEPSVFIRPCKQVLPSTCPQGTSATLSRKCSSSPTAYRYVSNTSLVYRNQFCALCHEDDLNSISCYDPVLRSPHAPLNHLRIHPLSILFDPNLLKRYLNNNTLPGRIYSTEYRCSKPNELYNIFEQQCTPIVDSTSDLVVSMNCSLPIQTTLQSQDHLFIDNGTLYLRDQSIFLFQDEYVFINDNHILFCYDRWNNQTESSTIDFTEDLPKYRHILSSVCTIISLICLILFIVAFFLISTLQNLPGRCLLFLSLSLFFGQLLFFISSSLTIQTVACSIAAILIQFFYLSSFIWLLVISVQIHSTFNHRNLQQDISERPNHLLLIYNLLVYCLAGIITLIGCLIQFIRSDSMFSPSYGLIYCSISNVNAMIVFFLVPIGVVLTMILFFFIKTLYSIHRSSSIAKLASSSTSSNINSVKMAFIYSRLAFLMGIQWILLVFALLIRQDWSWVIFEIVNSLPGVFICLGFLCSKRLFDSVRHQITTKILSRQQSSKSSLTNSTIISTSLKPMDARKMQSSS